jgi:hypothetical protein
MKHSVLIANRFISVPNAAGDATSAPDTHLATILSNMAYYGYAPSLDAVQALKALSAPELTAYWLEVEPSFKQLTGDDRGMETFVVYKNFPKEVLNMSSTQYWIAQIFMYLGAPADWFAQEPAERPALNELLKLKVLELAGEDTQANLYANLMRSTSRWTNDQYDYALFLYHEVGGKYLDLDAFGFKENGIDLMVATVAEDGEITISNATDVLRYAAALSGNHVSLRPPVAFKKWSRSERRLLLNLLDESRNLLADMGLRPQLWKKLLKGLHPGDYPFKKVHAAYDALYKGELTTFNGEVEALITAQDASVLTKLRARPGDFVRRFHKLYEVFGLKAVHAFLPVVGALETNQLLKLKCYLTTINERKGLIFAPKGNWTKAVFAANDKVPFTAEALSLLTPAIDAALQLRLEPLYPQGVELEGDVGHIKLQTNDQELASYGRGTVFAVPDDIQFIRTASYWKASGRTTWYDNGWNFFGEGWKYLDSCCWSGENQSVFDGGAVFSGDPVNSGELEGRACQMIDLNLEALTAAGVRYAVWNVLCYSRRSFAEAEDVLATLQWGVDPEAGALYEPARAQMVFPLKGSNLTKYVAYLDIAERKLVYLDANLYGNVTSAEVNGELLAERMPAMVEYLASLPSMGDYFSAVKAGEKKVTVEDCLTGNIT